MIVERQVELRFGLESREAETHTNLSAVRQDGRHLWVAGDETATIERLTAVSDATGRVLYYDDHLTVDLADLVDLPAGPEEEADIEGLARADGWLWAVGSHSLKRKRIKPGQSAAKGRRRLSTVVREENRYILARLPLVTGADGRPEVVREDGARTAALLGGKGDSITDLLDDDPHLAPFLRLPGKDNGVDIEGIAVHGDRIYLGLRGPVLRGWAVLIEIRPETHPDFPHRLRLRPFGPDDELYRTHFVELTGLGVRDLCPQGDDLLILAGPSMSLSGPVRLFRWPAGCTRESEGVVPAEELELLGDLPHGQGEDHAEGVAVLDEPPGDKILLVYDSPSDARHTAQGGMLADVVRLAP